MCLCLGRYARKQVSKSSFARNTHIKVKTKAPIARNPADQYNAQHTRFGIRVCADKKISQRQAAAAIPMRR